MCLELALVVGAPFPQYVKPTYFVSKLGHKVWVTYGISVAILGHDIVLPAECSREAAGTHKENPNWALGEKFGWFCGASCKKPTTLVDRRTGMAHHVAEKGHIELEHEVEAVRPLDLADSTTLCSVLQKTTPPAATITTTTTIEESCPRKHQRHSVRKRRTRRGVRLGTNAFDRTLIEVFRRVSVKRTSSGGDHKAGEQLFRSVSI